MEQRVKMESHPSTAEEAELVSQRIRLFLPLIYSFNDPCTVVAASASFM